MAELGYVKETMGVSEVEEATEEFWKSVVCKE